MANISASFRVQQVKSVALSFTHVCIFHHLRIQHFELLFLIMAATDVKKLVLGGKQLVSEQEEVHDIIPQPSWRKMPSVVHPGIRM